MVKVAISDHPVTGFSREVEIMEGSDYDGKYSLVMNVCHKEGAITRGDLMEAVLLNMPDYDAAKELLAAGPTDDDAHTAMIGILDTAGDFD